jgi:hypothetical protein
LAIIEAEIGRLDNRLSEMNQPRDFAVSLDDLKAFCMRRLPRSASFYEGTSRLPGKRYPNTLNGLCLRRKHPRMASFWKVSGDVEIFQGNGTAGDVPVTLYRWIPASAHV